MIRGVSDNLYSDKDDFSKSYQNFPSVLFLELTLFFGCIFPSELIMLMDGLAILFCNNPDIDKVNLDKIFLKVLLKWYSRSHWIFPRQK